MGRVVSTVMVSLDGITESAGDWGMRFFDEDAHPIELSIEDISVKEHTETPKVLISGRGLLESPRALRRSSHPRRLGQLVS